MIVDHEQLGVLLEQLLATPPPADAVEDATRRHLRGLFDLAFALDGVCALAARTRDAVDDEIERLAHLAADHQQISPPRGRTP